MHSIYKCTSCVILTKTPACGPGSNGVIWGVQHAQIRAVTQTHTTLHTPQTRFSICSCFLEPPDEGVLQRPLDGTFKRPAAKSRRLFVSESLAHNHTYPQTDTDKYPGISVDIYFLYLCCKCFSWCTGSYRSLTAVLKGLYFCSIYCHLHSNKKNTGERG